MTQGKVVRVVGVYRDPGLIERIMGTLRRLWVDVEWINGKIEGNTMEIHMKLKDSKNLKLAILNISKTVDVERVDVLEETEAEKEGNKQVGECFSTLYKRIATYTWGEEVS